MAVLKYKKKDGTYATLTNISIKGVDPKQTTGDSTTDVMSQAAITTYLGQKLAVSDFETYSGAVDTLIDGKASQGDLNTLNGVVTAHTANTTVHVTSSDKEKWNSVDDKLNTSDFNTYSGNVDTTINGKVDKIEGKVLSTNDYTTAEKEKLQGIAAGAEVNVNADWAAESGDAQILNKPTIGTAAAKGVSAGITNSDNLIESKHIYTGVGVTIVYDSNSKHIQLKSTSGNVLSSFDASSFIVDGMVENVEIKNVAESGTCLVVSFNTDSGKQDINIPISQIFDASNYYTTGQTSGSTQIQTALDGKSDTGHTHDDRYYTESELTGSSTTVVVAKANSATTAANAATANSVAWDNVDGKPTLSSATEVNDALSGKVDKVSGKDLSTNDYTTAEKEKLSGIESGAQVNVQSDWDATSGDTFIKNKPTIPDSFQWFGTSSTEADTVQKEVSIPSITSLKTGQIIVVQPTVTSTVASSTLKLNSFDAYPMRYNNAAITTSSDSIVWSANFPSLFVFDGSYWVFLGHGVDSNTTYSTMSVAEGTAGTATTSRTMRADYLKKIIQALAPQVHYSKVSVTSNLTNVTCPQTLSTDGEQCNVLYVNNSTQHTVSVSTNYKSPDNSQINLTIKANGYAEVNYLYFDGVTYVRAV